MHRNQTDQAVTALQQSEVPLQQSDLIFLICAAHFSDNPRMLAMLARVCWDWRNSIAHNSLWRKFIKKTIADQLPVDWHLQSLLANVHVRADTYYCIGMNVELSSDLLSCARESLAECDGNTIFRTRGEALRYIYDVTLRYGRRNEELDSVPFIFVVQLGVAPTKLSKGTVNDVTHRFVSTDPSNIVRVYEAIYRTSLTQPPQTIVIPAEQRRSFHKPFALRSDCTIV